MHYLDSTSQAFKGWSIKNIWILGYDTTSQTLAYAGYELVRAPEVQKRLQEEVDAAYEDVNGENPDYSVVQVILFLKWANPGLFLFIFVLFTFQFK